MAGLGSVCSHVAALLFKLQACTQLGLDKVASTPTVNNNEDVQHPQPYSFSDPMSGNDELRDIVGRNAAILTSIDIEINTDNSENDTVDEDDEAQNIIYQSH